MSASIPTYYPTTPVSTLFTAHSSLAARYSFSAKERDVETGLSYFGARYYSSDLSIWLSVDPQAAKYPSLSPYVYCANNPVRYVDPNGEDLVVANNEESHNDILSIVKECHRDRVSFGEDGKISVNMEGLKAGDAGLALLNDMSQSDKKYYYETSDVALCRNQNGRCVVFFNTEETLGCINASNGGLDSQYSQTNLPMDGFDGQVVISKTGDFYYNSAFPQRRKNVVFHELAENYFRTDKGMNYYGGPNNVESGGAHKKAKELESQYWGTYEAGTSYFAPRYNHTLETSEAQRAIKYLTNGTH